MFVQSEKFVESHGGPPPTTEALATTEAVATTEETARQRIGPRE
jgi:hypothetical protein